MVCLPFLLTIFPLALTASVPLVFGVARKNCSNRSSWIAIKLQVFDYALTRQRDHP